MERVYEAESHDGPSLEPPADVPWRTTGGPDERVIDLRDARVPQRRPGGSTSPRGFRDPRVRSGGEWCEMCARVRVRIA
jgi:hypothetical protein